jgi:hypothetical protein
MGEDVRFGVFMMIRILRVFWVLALFSVLVVSVFHKNILKVEVALMMEAVGFSVSHTVKMVHSITI